MGLLNEKIKSLLAVIQMKANAYLMKSGDVIPVFPTKDYSDITATISTDEVKQRLMVELFSKAQPDKDDYKNMLILMSIVHNLADVKNKTAVQKQLSLTFTDKVIQLRKSNPKNVKGKITIKDTKEKDPETNKPVGKDMVIEPEKSKSKKSIF